MHAERARRTLAAVFHSHMHSGARPYQLAGYGVSLPFLHEKVKLDSSDTGGYHTPDAGCNLHCPGAHFTTASASAASRYQLPTAASLALPSLR